MRADAGIVISASHNPFQDNGIKIFSRDGYKISDELETQIESLVDGEHIDDIRPTAHEVGKASRIDDAIGRYIVFCKNTFPDELTIEGLNVVLDCSHGATYKVAPIVFRELGADVTTLSAKPDGKNINLDCGSQHTEELSSTVRETGANVGLAFDGDGDRLIAVDERGIEITGDHILAICARHMKENGGLPGDLIVCTPMSNFGLQVALKEMGVKHLEAPVGDRNVLAVMSETGAVLGGEQSGHIIFANHHSTGDGIVSALQLVAIMRQSGKTLSELADVMTLSPQRLISVPVMKKPPIEDIPGLDDAVEEARKELRSKGRVLVRYSGTEQICRVMVEGPAEDITERLAGSLVDIIRDSIGA
jgi:phosphoglucosamine mutase